MGSIVSIVIESRTASIVFNPVPVIRTTVFSFLFIDFVLVKFFNAEMTTPPAVSVNIPSVSANNLIPSATWSSGTIEADPEESLAILTE